MSRGERQERRRKEREAIKEAERFVSEMNMADRELLLKAVDQHVSDMKAPAAKIPARATVVQKRLRSLIAESGIIQPLTALLREHPGKPSTLKVEALILSGLMSIWQDYSYLRTDGLSHLLSLPPAVQDELGMEKKNGDRGLTYRCFHKQLERLEDALMPQGEGDNIYDTKWMECQMAKPTVPKGFLDSVEAVAVDQTADRAWYRMQCDKKQEDVNKEVAAIYRQRHPGTPLPPMSEQVMRDMAGELGVPIGLDGRIERNAFDPTLRSGYKTATQKDPDNFYVAGVSQLLSLHDAILCPATQTRLRLVRVLGNIR